MMNGEALRLFIAHGRHDDAARLMEMKVDVLSLARHEWPMRDVAVALGRDDYREEFSRCGGWDQWCHSVATGLRSDRAPRYHGIVLPTPEAFGKATASIVRYALGAQKPVLAVRRGALRIVHQLVERNVTDMKAGWSAA